MRNRFLKKYALAIGASLMVSSASSIAAQQPTTTAQVYVGISLNTKKDANNQAFETPGPFLTAYFNRLFTQAGGHAKNNLHMTFFQGTAAKVSCYATPQPGSRTKNIKCYATGEDITPQERADLNDRLKATYDLTLNTLYPANPLKVNLDLTPRYRESTADKYFVMLDFDSATSRELGKVLNVFRLFLGHKNYDLTQPLSANLTQFPLVEEIQTLSDTARAKIDHFKATNANHQTLQYINIIKKGTEVPATSPICCHGPNQAANAGCLDMQASITSVNPVHVKCYILGAKKWYTGVKPPSSHVTLIDHTIIDNKETLKTLIASKMKYATQKTKSLALTNIPDTHWTKPSENILKGAIYRTLTHDQLCGPNQNVNPTVRGQLEKLLPTEKKIVGKNYSSQWTQACKIANRDTSFNEEGHLRAFGPQRPHWDGYPGNAANLFTDYPHLVKWLIENELEFDLKELGFHD
ncbi:MAG: hypothetical protein K0M45_09730 [Candidatus Paracaedibacteraceae bacterium]|nr:hypothetical protein [Candidatus Paracaedibacteraceae bacterium]